MERLEFRIEAVSGALVFAVLLGEWRNFSVGEGARLGDCPLRPGLGMPRMLAADGSPRLDVFAFTLLRADDAERLTVGAVVVLEGGGRTRSNPVSGHRN